MRRKEALKKANITHVVSALRLPLDENLFVDYKHHVVELDDVEDENIVEHFAGSNAFIQEGLEAGGGVLIHWWVKYIQHDIVRSNHPFRECWTPLHQLQFDLPLSS